MKSGIRVPNSRTYRMTHFRWPHARAINKTVAESRLERLQAWTEIAKSVAQIIALVVAGMWAYAKFIRTEAPLHTPKGITNAELEWSPTSDTSTCRADFTLHLENVGTQPFRVISVRVSVWIFDVGGAHNQTLRLVDESAIMRSPPTFQQNFDNTALCRTYAPKTISFQMFSWFVQKEPHKAAFFKAAFISEPDLQLEEYRWGTLCP